MLTAPRVKIRSSGGVRLLANGFGPDGAEFRTATSPTDLQMLNEDDDFGTEQVAD